jgi:hypothetical protein
VDKIRHAIHNRDRRAPNERRDSGGRDDMTPGERRNSGGRW